MCTILLPSGVNPIAVNKYIDININKSVGRWYLNGLIARVHKHAARGLHDAPPVNFMRPSRYSNFNYRTSPGTASKF